MRHGLIYLAFIVPLIAGIVLIANPYVEYLLQICVTYGDGHTECRNEVIRSFKLPLLLSGVLSTVTSIVSIVVYTIVILILRSRKKKRGIVKAVKAVKDPYPRKNPKTNDNKPSDFLR